MLSFISFAIGRKRRALKLLSISKPSLKSQLSSPSGLTFKIGGFNVNLSSSIGHLAGHLIHLYGEYELTEAAQFTDFHVALNPPQLLRRFIRPQVVFSFDGHIPFKPLPFEQASALFEWGLNWCIANHSNQFLILHAAVVEKNGQAIIFPGSPGSGKSTLCAALILSGWRLLSDEMALISTAEGLLYPVPRPVSLKNESIDVIRRFSESAVFGQIVKDTAKGSVGHLRPPKQSVELSTVPVTPSRLIFPKYREGSKTMLTELDKGKAMLRAAEDCFNYNVLGALGFDILGDTIDRCDCFTFEYSDLYEAVRLFDGFHG